MASKNNLKYIFILALGFFVSSAIYLSQNTILEGFTSFEFSNRISILFGDLAMAFGILTFSLVYKKTKNIKKYYILSMSLTIFSLLLFYATTNVILMSICLCLSCFFGAAGFCGGYHFSLIASNVERKNRGRVFAFGYGAGSILAFLIALLPNNINNIYLSIFLFIPLLILNIFLIVRNNSLNEIKINNKSKDFRKNLVLLIFLVVAMSLLSDCVIDLITIKNYNVEWLFFNSRLYYSLGLIIAGIIYDKFKDIFDYITLSSFVFYLISLMLINQSVSSNIVIGICYFMIGFFVVFRAVSFMNLIDTNKNNNYLSAYGLMFARIGEVILAITEAHLLNNFVLLIIIESVILVIILCIYIYLYIKNKYIKEDDKLKELSLKYRLSSIEEKVLDLLVKDFTRQEIADKLYLSINTIKVHVRNIYKKTNMNKQELKEFYHLRAK